MAERHGEVRTYNYPAASAGPAGARLPLARPCRGLSPRSLDGSGTRAFRVRCLYPPCAELHAAAGGALHPHLDCAGPSRGTRAGAAAGLSGAHDRGAPAQPAAGASGHRGHHRHHRGLWHARLAWRRVRYLWAARHPARACVLQPASRREAHPVGLRAHSARKLETLGPARPEREAGLAAGRVAADQGQPSRRGASHLPALRLELRHRADPGRGPARHHARSRHLPVASRRLRSAAGCPAGFRATGAVREPVASGTEMGRAGTGLSRTSRHGAALRRAERAFETDRCRAHRGSPFAAASAARRTRGCRRPADQAFAGSGCRRWPPALASAPQALPWPSPSSGRLPRARRARPHGGG